MSTKNAAWKFAFQPPKSLPPKKHLHNSITAHTNVTHSHVSKRATMSCAVAHEVRSLAAKDTKLSRPPYKLPRHSQSSDTFAVGGKPPASQRSVGGPKRGVGRIQKVLPTNVTVNAEFEGEKENEATADRHSVSASKLSALILSTPLTHSRRSSLRQTEADLSSCHSADAGQAADTKPGAGLHTTPHTAIPCLPGADESDHCQETTHQPESQELEADERFTVKATSATLVGEGSDEPSEGKHKRDSLSSQFRKQKSQPAAVRSRCQPAAKKPVVGKAAKSVVVAAKTWSLVQPPRKSILKHKPGIALGSATGASPFLSAVRKSVSNPDNTSHTGMKFAPNEGQGHDGGSEKETGHVTFVTGVHMEAHGANFRKTPAMATKIRKTQENLRARLNEWRASSGLTPSIRHACCFHSDNNSALCPTPRSQVKPSITVEQLSRQENALVQEDLKKNLTACFNTVATQPAPSRRSIVAAPQTSSCSSATSYTCYTPPEQQDAETGKMDISWDSPSSSKCPDSENQDAAGRGAPEFDTESWDICRLDADFDKCLVVLEAKSLSADAALGWLDGIQEAYGDVRYNIGWYKCRIAALMAKGDVDDVLAVFEQAIISNVQPAEEMAKLLTTTMKEMLASQNRCKKGSKSATSLSKSTGVVTRKRRLLHQGPPRDVQEDNMFTSTTVKYSVVEVTPFSKRRRVTECGERLVPVVTPVRRSTRLSAVKAVSFSEGRAKAAAHQFSREYTALHDVPSAEKEKMLFQVNKALEPLLSDDSGEQEVSENQE